ncbi:MAG: ATP-binding cassette domain-containing protein [Nitrospiraceae bacterium]
MSVIRKSRRSLLRRTATDADAYDHPIIRFDHATFGFPGVVALEDLTLTIPESEFVGVIGPNGSGKTTLCRAVVGLMKALSGFPSRSGLRL